MSESKSGYFRVLVATALMGVVLSGCTHVNPATGQSEIDYGATAGVAGAALGAAALGVALSNNDDDRYYGPGYYGGGGGYYGAPAGGVYRGGNSYTKVNNVNVNRTQSVKGGERNRNVRRNQNQLGKQAGGFNRPAGRPQARPAKVNRGGAANRARVKR